jgi:hypothetical protein
MSLTDGRRHHGLKDACREFQACYSDGNTVPIVKAAAAASLQVILYRLGEHEAARRLEPPLDRGAFSRLACTMRALAACCRGDNYVGPVPVGIGLAQVSPVLADGILEESLLNEPTGK